MDIRQKLEHAHAITPKASIRLQELLSQLSLLAADSNELPKKFWLQSTLTQVTIQTFLEEVVKLQVKSIQLVPVEFLSETYAYEVHLR